MSLWKLALPLLAAALLGSCDYSSADRCVSDYVGPPKEGLTCTPSAAGTTLPAGMSRQATSAPAPGPLRVSVCQAVLLALENNRSFNVDRYNPSIQRTNEQMQLAAFDPVLNASYSFGKTRVDHNGVSDSNSGSADIALTEFLPTGTNIALDLHNNFNSTDLVGDQLNTRIGLTVTQSLLRGYGLDVNLASLRQAQLGTRISEYVLRGQAETLVSDVETAYWNYALTQRQIQIQEEGLKVAEQQLSETQERINVGTVAEVELAAPQAQVAIQRESLINARSAAEVARLQLLRLMSPGDGSMFDRQVILTDIPEAPGVRLDPVENHIAVAELFRPDMNEARLQVKSGELQVVKTRNGLLPVLDAFVTLGKTGYSESLGGTFKDLVNQSSFDVQGGLSFQYPIGNRGPRAANLAAVLSKQQMEESLKNLQQSVELDVRNAYIELLRTREQVAATAVTRKAQEAVYRTEAEKLAVGKNTSFQVAQAQRDLVTAQINEIAAVVQHLKSFTDLYRLEGSLLERRGVLAPGRQPAGPLIVEQETTVRPPCPAPPLPQG
jgi:outer membrane protein TolC